MMTSRLYRTTRPLAARTTLILRRFGVEDVAGTPTTGALIALYVAGLILLDGRQTQTRVALFLPGRAHDALNRLLRVMPLSTRALMGALVAWVKRHGEDGYLCIDDCVVEKAFARKLPWAGWTYSFAKKRKVYGLHIVVVLLWCGADGGLRIPVAFRLWRPKRSCAPRAYRTKLELARAMLKEVTGSGLRPGYVVFDTHYTAGWFTKFVGRLDLVWVGTLNPRTIVFWRSQRQSVAELAQRLPLKWRKHLGVRARALNVYAPKYGAFLRLVVTRNRHGNHEYIVTNGLKADLTTVAERKVSRWQVETLFRDTKQYGGLEACQCRVDQAMVRHVGLVLLTFVVLQMMRRSAQESLGSVKERWQLEVMRDGQLPPPPLKACPPNLRATA